jgi:hypothetical protein
MSTPTLDLGQTPQPDPTPTHDPGSPDAGANASAATSGEKPAPGQPTESPPSPQPDRTASGLVGSPAEQLILQRDLNEALLLMDFISGRPDVHIWDIGDIKYPVRVNNPGTGGDANQGANPTPTLPPIEVIRRICALRYPPEMNQSLSERADNSALLLCVKDKLNSIAHPANGLTIAYTYMFLEETAQSRRGESSVHQPIVIVEKGTRATVAKAAYPGLIPSGAFPLFSQKRSSRWRRDHHIFCDPFVAGRVRRSINLSLRGGPEKCVRCHESDIHVNRQGKRRYRRRPTKSRHRANALQRQDR